MRSLVTLLICGSVALPAAQFAYGQAARTAARGQGAARSGVTNSRIAVPGQGTAANRALNAAGQNRVVTGTPLPRSAVNSGAAYGQGLRTTTPAVGYEQGTQGLSGTSDVISVEQTLTAAQAAELRADLANIDELRQVYDAQTDLLDAVNEENPPAERALTEFIDGEVTGWTCGEACLVGFKGVLNASTEYARTRVEEGELVDVRKAFTAGLKKKGVESAVAEQCPALAPAMTI